MALLWIEGFEGFGDTINVAPRPTGIVGRKYAVVGTENYMRVMAGRYGYCLKFMARYPYFHSANLTTDDTVVIGAAIKLSSIGSAPLTVFWLYENATIGINLKVNSSGNLAVYLNTILLGTSVNTIDPNDWYYIEMKVLTHDSAGAVDVHVNESNWLSLSGIDTQPGANAYHSAFRIGPGIDSALPYVDDLYFLDGTGSINNDFLGNQTVEAIRPNSTGDSTEWIPLAGNNYENVDEVVFDADTTYVETGITTKKDLYNYGSLASINIINGIQIATEARMTLGSMDLHSVIKSGATEDDGIAETLVSTDYETITRISELNPDTLSPWSQPEIDAAQFGAKAI